MSVHWTCFCFCVPLNTVETHFQDFFETVSPGNPELWISSTPKSKPSRLTRNKSNESGPTWSPDGRRILLTSDARGKPQIYEVSISTGILTRIPTNVSSHCTEPAWNPRYPNKFAFTAAISGGFQVCEYENII